MKPGEWWVPHLLLPLNNSFVVRISIFLLIIGLVYVTILGKSAGTYGWRIVPELQYEGSTTQVLWRQFQFLTEQNNLMVSFACCLFTDTDNLKFGHHRSKPISLNLYDKSWISFWPSQVGKPDVLMCNGKSWIIFMLLHAIEDKAISQIMT